MEKTLLHSIAKDFQKLSDYNDFGAGEGIRTLDFNLGKVALYPWATPAYITQLPLWIYKSIFEKTIHLNLFLYTISTSNIWGRVSAASPIKITFNIDSYNDKFWTK